MDKEFNFCLFTIYHDRQSKMVITFEKKLKVNDLRRGNLNPKGFTSEHMGRGGGAPSFSFLVEN
jgi:hypothetical protein